LWGFLVGFVGAQQLAKDVGENPAVAVVRRLAGASNRSRLLKGGCGCRNRGHVPHSDTPHAGISRSTRGQTLIAAPARHASKPAVAVLILPTAEKVRSFEISRSISLTAVEAT
jgi:hypothetical protein